MKNKKAYDKYIATKDYYHNHFLFYFVAIIVTLTICDVHIWKSNYVEYKKLHNDHSHAIVIYNNAKTERVLRQNVQISNETEEKVQTVDDTENITHIATQSVEMSAYTSRIEETDDSPCISADGTNICEYDGCVVASNDYPLGTVINVEGFGMCEVRDRMNARYTSTGNMDIYFGMDLDGALAFGRKNVNIQVL